MKNLVKIKRHNKEGYITHYGTNDPVLVPAEYQEKDPHLRGVWFSTVKNIDIPKMTNPEQYKEYLHGVIDKVKEYNLNTIIFQVRPSNDAFYESEINPWSRFITGVEGEGLGFDIFGWFIEEAKKANISVHAWINPYRVSTDSLLQIEGVFSKEDYLNRLHEKNFARNNPECVVYTNEGRLILDPASQKVRDYVTETVMELARKYDIKAVHIDDYFYPYDGVADPFEQKKFELVKDQFETLDDFRRENVNLLIKQISEVLKTLDKKVEFGISPFGIHRTNSKHFPADKPGGWEYGSNNRHTCLQAYERLYCDVYLWMEQKWIDYVVPQAYWDLDNSKEVETEDGSIVEISDVKYADVVLWWQQAAKKTNTKLYIGQGIYRYKDEGAWSNPEEIINQLKYNNQFDNILGSIFFTYKNFVEEHVNSLAEARRLLKEVWIKEVKEI